MGFGSVIATALAVIVLMAAGYMLVDGITRSADVAVSSLKASGDLKDRQLKTALVMDGFIGNRTSGTMSFQLRNAGAEKIEDISLMDVIVKFTDAGGDNVEAGWVPYSPDGSGPLCWSAGDIASPIGDAINPGMLDPGETMTINLSESGGFPTNYGWVQVTAPCGTAASGSFLVP
jgi:hypothetical protein